MVAKLDLDGTIKFVTPAKNDILGYGISNVVGRNFFDFIYIDDKKNVVEEIRKLVRTTTNQKIEFRAVHAEGRILWVDVSFNTLLDDNNKVVGLILSARDITKRIEAEEVIRENKEKTRLLNQAMEYDRFRTDFFANISHELRTPINVILGTLQLMELKFKELFNESEKKNKRYLRTMKQNCYRLVRLINNLIDVTKIDAGYFEIHLGNCNIVVSVKDTGIGIPKEKQQCIFDRFIQVDKSLTRNREGSGIGLSLVMALVEMHGGRMFLESEIGIGSEFSFELPIKQLAENEEVFVNSNLNANSNIEKIHIEFSDIYF